jgi:hypothetical protein
MDGPPVDHRRAAPAQLEGVNRESIRQILKKTSVNLGAK